MQIHESGFLDRHALVRARDSVALRHEKLPADALRVLAQEVIARLAERFAPVEPTTDMPRDAEIDTLADALISDDADAAATIITGLRENGTPLDVIHLGHIAGAARRLGERWDRDEIHFSSVTIGASRLYVIMRAIRPTYISHPKRGLEGGPILFASTPGEDHTLGVTMAADLFRETGWEVDLRTDLSHDEIIETAVSGHYPVIGLSASSRRMIVPLTRLIASLHVSTPISSIMVSGPLAEIESDLARLVDADCVVSGASQAMTEMRRLMSEIGGKDLLA